MGFFRCLTFVAGGIGAVVLAPVTGGGSLALAIGAMGTTTIAGAAIGAGVGAAAAAIAHATLLKLVLPRKDITEDEVLRQLEVRHRKRQASIDAAYRKQQKDGMLPLVACSPK